MRIALASQAGGYQRLRGNWMSTRREAQPPSSSVLARTLLPIPLSPDPVSDRDELAQIFWRCATTKAPSPLSTSHLTIPDDSSTLRSNSEKTPKLPLCPLTNQSIRQHCRDIEGKITLIKRASRRLGCQKVVIKTGKGHCLKQTIVMPVLNTGQMENWRLYQMGNQGRKRSISPVCG